MTVYGQRFDRCPKAELRDAPAVLEALEDFERLEAGFLPFAGGWQEQPARFVDAQREIRAELAECAEIAAARRAAGG